MFRLQNFRFGIARFLLGLYIAVLTNGVAFRHAHRLSDGTIICHAHPYKSSGSQFPQHAHSRDELIWLDGIANAIYANPDFVIWVPLLLTVVLFNSNGRAVKHFHFVSSHFAFRHRGPPARLV
ncbi:hypothetical protein [Spirosoma terrae]|uniref:Uncharacterized protein n=1 Tax=Spirosoma terrae TaxID=1968276 RepID=A0A6L9LBM8_9BACT|nr:hypothetical protein [Spirosoma terrae]NDU97955.1 hypothetical protein [Spirosoma terrae]